MMIAESACESHYIILSYLWECRYIIFNCISVSVSAKFAFRLPLVYQKIGTAKMISFSIASVSFTLIISLFVSKSNADQILLSPVITNWGIWGSFERCPAGTYIKAFQLKTEPFKGPTIDDTCLNSIRFFCGDPLDGRTTVLKSSEGSWGIWGNVYSCNDGHVIGFQLRVERPHLVSDETATNNLRVFCSNALGYYIEGDGNAFGDWTTAQICASHEYACGLQTQVQPDQGILLDDTALNNVNVQCCNITTTAAASG